MTTLPHRIFVANRGEIALRVLTSCSKLGIETVLGVSAADRSTLPARRASRTICIGPAAAQGSYLNVQAIVHAAKATGCTAVHPGYGFLSERPQFAEACASAGLTFIGPASESIRAMGDKLNARSLAIEAEVPVVPGTEHLASAEQAKIATDKIGFPVLLKASAGGGGRGMRVVRGPEALQREFEAASSEAQAAFGDGRLYLERYVKRARHIEIQVLGDSFGNIIHLGERDCSTQRRHQKLIEEAPSSVIAQSVRDAMAGAAVRLARRVNYVGAGTVEFIYDLDTEQFYFLEMNTRIQVEHPATEEVTGIDIVSEQIKVAAGNPLTMLQANVSAVGHAIECRINAEDPEKNFRPSPGIISVWRAPIKDGIRIDSHCYEGYAVPPFYDSMLGKVIAHAETRPEAIRKMLDALEEFTIEGVSTTIPLHKAILRTREFESGNVTTDWVEKELLRQL